MALDQVEGRIVGSLIEKQLSTPQQYPLSRHSLTLACNQASNRDPVLDLSEEEVQHGLDSLKAKGLLRFVLPSHGRSVVRYRHVLDEKLALDARQLALLAVLLLRGPQTVGELRVRTERMSEFEGTSAVESDLEGLSRWEEPLVARTERRPGQKEERWIQLLTDPDLDPAAEPPRESPAVGPPAGGGLGIGPQVEGAWVDELRQAVSDLRAEVSELRAELEELRRALGE